MARPTVKLSIGYQDYLLPREDAAQVAALLAGAQALDTTADYNKELGEPLRATYITRDRSLSLGAPPEVLHASHQAAQEWIASVRAAQQAAKDAEARAQAAEARARVRVEEIVDALPQREVKPGEMARIEEMRRDLSAL